MRNMDTFVYLCSDSQQGVLLWVPSSYRVTADFLTRCVFNTPGSCSASSKLTGCSFDSDSCDFVDVPFDDNHDFILKSSGGQDGKGICCLIHVVWVTLCFLSMFFCLSSTINIFAETKFASQEAKMFPSKFKNILLTEVLVPYVS